MRLRCDRCRMPDTSGVLFSDGKGGLQCGACYRDEALSLRAKVAKLERLEKILELFNLCDERE